jgi:hypothetical protein
VQLPGDIGLEPVLLSGVKPVMVGNRNDGGLER